MNISAIANDTGVGQLAHEKPSPTLIPRLNIGAWSLLWPREAVRSLAALGSSRHAA